METDKYKVFLKVVECESFSRAAAELGYTQSAVSHCIYSLEQALGFRLLTREGRKTRLTSAGQEAMPFIIKIVNSQTTLDQWASFYLGVGAGKLCIASIPSLAIHTFPDMVKRFNDRCPNIQIQLLHGNYSDVERLLASGTVEFGFLSVSSQTPFPFVNLYREKLAAILPPGHPLAEKERLSLKDLEPESFIMPGEGPRHQVGELIKNYNLNLNVKYCISDDDITISMVSRGLGVTILPEMSYRDYLNFQFEVRDLTEAPYRDIGIAYTAWVNISPIGKAFIKLAKESFAPLTP